MYSLESKDSFSDNEAQLLFDGLNEQAFKSKKMSPMRPYAVFIRRNDGITCGGATGFTCYGALLVDMLWVESSLRNQGFGKKIMKEVEEIAKKRGCTFINLNTMDWEALPFYQKLGYEIEFIRTGYENNSKMYQLKKDI